MPSGSHSGGGGSHFGGGSSGGSHFGGFNSSGSSRQVNLGPRVYVFGGRRYVVSGSRRTGIYALNFVILFMVFIVFAGALMLAGGNKAVKTIKADHARYQQMITYAKENNDFLIYGVITDQFKNDECDKYYITYAFPIDYIDDKDDLLAKYHRDVRSGDFEIEWVQGYSYSVYSLAQVSALNMQRGSLVELAINNEKSEIDQDTDSIPTDYLNMPLNRDGEYTAAKSKKTAGSIMIVISAVVIVGCVAGQIAVIKTCKPEQAPVEADQPIDQGKAAPQQKVNKCAYCGAVLKEGETKCPNCGGGQL